MSLLLETTLPNIYHRGKVRDSYDLGDRLLIVATDRISAFDVILPNGIPDKGKVLTQLSAFWFDHTASVVPNHVIRLADGSPADGLPFPLPEEFKGRSMIVRKAERVDVECVVRGYLSGSAWTEYRDQGTIGGMPAPAGLLESDQLPEPTFTPTTKAESGHDLPITQAELVAEVGAELAEILRVRSLAIYNYAAEYARQRGLIIADTKFEFGRADGEWIVIDEMLTPDSSRFWAVDDYEPGRPQHAFDKQFVRDWLNRSGWNHEPPPPVLPDDVVEATAERYREAFRRVTGRELA